MGVGRQLRSRVSTRDHMSLGEDPSIGGEELVRMFHIPGLKAYQVKKTVHLDAFCGRLKPTPKGLTSEAIKEEEARGILSRALYFMTPGMQARCIKFSVEEVEAQPELCRDQLSEHLWRYATVSMNNAVVALGSLHKFVLEHFERCIFRSDYTCSPGVISMYLTAHEAPTMQKHRLVSLRYAQNHLGALCEANSAQLNAYSKKVELGSHARATPIRVALFVSSLAVGGANTYVRTSCGGFMMMILASLRWFDAEFSNPPKVEQGALRGFASRTKMDAAKKMFWACSLADFTGDTRWHAEHSRVHSAVLPGLGIEPCGSLFPNFDGNDAFTATGWAAGPAPKRKVLATWRAILAMPALDLSAEEQKAYGRMHGMRRVLAILARMLSGKLRLTLEDRNEMGRWSISAMEGGSGKHGAMPNLYSSEAAWPRQLEVREKVMGHAREVINGILGVASSGHLAFPSTDDISCFLSSAGDPDVAEPEPGLETDEPESDEA